MRATRVRLCALQSRRRSNTRSLLVEQVEARCLLTTFTVFNTNDLGPGSLRQAITDANATPNDSPALPDIIDFNIPVPQGATSQQVTISLQTPLPTITDPVIIDGYTQAGSSGNQTVGGIDEQETDVAAITVHVDGSLAGPNANGFTVDTVNTTIDGLAITGFGHAGIELDPGPSLNTGTIGCNIWGNFIGVSSWDKHSFNDMVRGTSPGANGIGILIQSSNNSIGTTFPTGRNIIQGNTGPGIELTGQGIGNLVNTNFILDNGGDGVLIESSNNSIGEPIGVGPAGAGNLISNNVNGVHIVGAAAKGNIVINNEIGTEVGLAGVLPTIRGMNPRGNLLNGVYIEDAPGNDVGGLISNSHNVIAANGLDGVSIQNVTTQGATGNRVMGNWIGYNLRNGLISLMPNRDGVNISSAGNVVGGDSTSAQNKIIANARNGITISGHSFDINDNIIPGQDNPEAQPIDNVVAGNFIGTQGGVEDYGNALAGVLIDDAANNTVGGTDSASRNVISGNNDGIEIRDHLASANVVEGNFIGTMSDGVTVLGNSLDGIRILNAPNNIVGGTTPGSGNVISGNNNGVEITGTGSTQNLVLGNFIGTDLTAKVEVHNSIDGVVIDQNASNNTVGGTTTGAGNSIAFNVANGVDVLSGVDNAILSNSIFNNVKLGIDLGGDGVTPNHTGNATGPNNYQNYPSLSSVSPNGLGINVQGLLNSLPNTTYTIQFFSNLSLDRSGFGQGGTPIGQLTVTTDGNGNAPFNTNISASVPSGEFVTATATDPSGNSSEFSNSLPAVPVSVQFNASSYQVNQTAGTATITVTRTGGTGGQVSVAYATSDGTAKAGTNYTATSGTLTFLPGQTTQVFTIPILVDKAAQNVNDTVTLTLSSPTGGATLGTNASATLSIQIVNQIQMQLSAPTYSVSESGHSLVVTVTRNTSTGASSVSYTTGGGTAVPGTDYTPVSGTLNFADGQTSQTFTIPIIDAGRIGGARSVGVGLNAPQGGTLGSPSSAVVTIQDNDSAGVLQFSSPSYAANAGAGAATIVVTRLGGTAGVTTVGYSTGGGNAVPGQDYTPVSGTLTFLPGQITQTIAVPLIPHTVTGVLPSFNIALSSPTGGAVLGGIGQATVTILGNPQSQVTPPATGGPGPEVENYQLVAGPGGISAIVFTFSKPLDPVTATNLGNYGYFVFNTNGIPSVPLRSAVYDPTSFKVVLTPSVPLSLNSFYQLRLDQQSNSAIGIGITDTQGNLLDGAGNGGSGTPYTATFAVGSSLAYADAFGNAVSLQLKKGGLIELNQAPNGNAQLVSIIGAVPGKSTLTGSVHHPRRGHNSTPIPQIQTGGAVVKLKSPPFALGQITAQSIHPTFTQPLHRKHGR